MSAKKQKRREQIGGAENNPQNVMTMAQPLPGQPQGAGNMANNPMNVQSFGPQLGSETGQNLYPYMDGGGMFPQMGAQDGRTLAPNQQPQNVALYSPPVAPEQFPMQMPQGNVMGQRLNSTAPYGMQQQPPSQMADQMESMRQGGEAQMKGLFPSAMGPGAMPGAVLPAQVPGAMPSQNPMMQGMPNAEMAPQGAQMGMNTGRGGGRNKK